jgi:hypothetical protein
LHDSADLTPALTPCNGRKQINTFLSDHHRKKNCMNIFRNNNSFAECVARLNRTKYAQTSRECFPEMIFSQSPIGLFRFSRDFLFQWINQYITSSPAMIINVIITRSNCQPYLTFIQSYLTWADRNSLGFTIMTNWIRWRYDFSLMCSYLMLTYWGFSLKI